MKTCSAVAILFVALFLAACGKSTPTTSEAPAPQASPSSSEANESEAASAALPTTTEIKHVDASGFALGEYLPTLDGGKIELAVPDGWQVMPRDSKYVVRFSSLQSGGGLPRIEVIAEDNKLAKFSSVTEANVAEFTAAVAKDLETTGTAVIEPPIPMVIGSVPCARYVSKLKLKVGGGTLVVERQTLAILHAGRVYKINLLVELDKLTVSRDAAYTLCAGIRFPVGE